MRWLGALVLVGCAAQVPPPIEPLGSSHEPYAGIPRTLLVASAGASFPTVTLPLPADRDRVRALCAALDAHVLALRDRDAPEDRAALALTVDELAKLVAPFPRLAVIVGEISGRLVELPWTPPERRGDQRARLLELTDQLRLELDR
jgi:hypothetical protein